MDRLRKFNKETFDCDMKGGAKGEIQSEWWEGQMEEWGIELWTGRGWNGVCRLGGQSNVWGVIGKEVCGWILSMVVY